VPERIVFGVRPVGELVRAHARDVSVVYVSEGKHTPEVAAVIQAAKERDISVEARPRRLIADLAGGAPAHQGIVAVAGDYTYASLDDILEAAAKAQEPALVLVLDEITDQHNLGALVRSAEVLGAHGVVIPSHDAAPVRGGSVKASAGATERMRIARVSNFMKALDELKARGLKVLGARAEGATTLAEADLTGAVALVVGSEGRGLREAVARRCDHVVAIPQRGAVSSLNASVAGAILLYEARRQRDRGRPEA